MFLSPNIYRFHSTYSSTYINYFGCGFCKFLILLTFYVFYSAFGVAQWLTKSTETAFLGESGCEQFFETLQLSAKILKTLTNFTCFVFNQMFSLEFLFFQIVVGYNYPIV